MPYREIKHSTTAGRLRSAVLLYVMVSLLSVTVLGSCVTSPETTDAARLEEVRRNKEAAVERIGPGPSIREDTAREPALPPAQETGSPPPWIDAPPFADEEFYYGTGRAGLDEENPAILARERALADIAGQIAVTVRRETTDYIGEKSDGKTTISSQEIEETIRTSADARLRNPEVVDRYQDIGAIYLLARVSKKTELSRQIGQWTRSLGLTRFRAGDFIDSRGINTGFGEFLRDSVISQCASSGTVCVDEGSVTEISGKYAILSGSISITLRATDPAGTIVSQKMFDVPAEPDYIAMMTTRRDNSLVNAVPTAAWGGGTLSLPSDVLHNGEEFAITFVPEVDCYVNIFNLTEDGTVTLLVPNRFQRDNYINGGDSFNFPEITQKQKGIVLKAYLPPGRAVTRESIKVVATQKPVDFAAGGFAEAVMESYRPDSDGIRRLLSTLQGLDDRGIRWFEAVQYFTIRAK